MNRKSQQPRQLMVLCEIEKLDARHPKLVFSVKAWLDLGRTTEEIRELIRQQFQVPVTSKMVETFRARRWVPEKELVKLKLATTKAAIEAFGGDAGFDAVLLAKLWELMDEMTIPQLLSARTLFLKVRAQNLKEQEFLYKTGQLRPEQEVDPQQQQRNVLRRIKEIFGLAGDEPAPLPAAKTVEAEAEPVKS